MQRLHIYNYPRSSYGQTRPASLVNCLIKVNCKILGDQAATCIQVTDGIRRFLNKINLLPLLG